MTAIGASIRRVDLPEPGLLCFEINRSPHKYLLLSATRGAIGAALHTDRVRGLQASPFVTQLRQHLVGTRVSSVSTGHNAVCVSLLGKAGTFRLIGQSMRRRSSWWLVDADEKTLVQTGDAGRYDRDKHWHEVSWDELGSAMELMQARLDVSRQSLREAAGRSIKKLTRRRTAIEGDLKRAEQATVLRSQAQLLVANLHQVSADATEVTLTDWTSQQPIVFHFDDGRTPAQTADRLFKRAKKLDRGVPIARKRLAEAQTAIEAASALVQDIDGTSTAGALRVAWDRAATLGLLPATSSVKSRRSATPNKTPFRRFVGTGGVDVLVGRGAIHNDQLTLRVARPHDLWLHARGMAGAHVVVRLDRNAEVSSDLLVDAATLAVHFSAGRHQAVVDVLYTPRRFVRKRRGAPAGSVTLEREKVVAVRMEPTRLARLLATETPS